MQKIRKERLQTVFFQLAFRTPWSFRSWCPGLSPWIIHPSLSPVASQDLADSFASHRSFHPSCWLFTSKPGSGGNLLDATELFQLSFLGLSEHFLELILKPHHLIRTWSRPAGEVGIADPWQAGQSWTIKELVRLAVIAFRTKSVHISTVQVMWGRNTTAGGMRNQYSLKCKVLLWFCCVIGENYIYTLSSCLLKRGKGWGKEGTYRNHIFASSSALAVLLSVSEEWLGEEHVRGIGISISHANTAACVCGLVEPDASLYGCRPLSASGDTLLGHRIFKQHPTIHCPSSVPLNEEWMFLCLLQCCFCT